MMSSSGVQWREPLHDFWILIGYGIVDIYDLVVTIRYVIAVGITVTNRGRIGCVVHDMPSDSRTWIRYHRAVAMIAMLKALGDLRKLKVGMVRL